MENELRQLMQQNEALRSKVASAHLLVEWLSRNISGMEYCMEEKKLPLEQNEGYQALVGSMRDGYMASYHDEFSYRDMHDDKIFPNKVA